MSVDVANQQIETDSNAATSVTSREAQVVRHEAPDNLSPYTPVYTRADNLSLYTSSGFVFEWPHHGKYWDSDTRPCCYPVTMQRIEDPAQELFSRVYVRYQEPETFPPAQLVEWLDTLPYITQEQRDVLRLRTGLADGYRYSLREIAVL